MCYRNVKSVDCDLISAKNYFSRDIGHRHLPVAFGQYELCEITSRVGDQQDVRRFRVKFYRWNFRVLYSGRDNRTECISGNRRIFRYYIQWYRSKSDFKKGE